MLNLFQHLRAQSFATISHLHADAGQQPCKMADRKTNNTNPHRRVTSRAPQILPTRPTGRNGSGKRMAKAGTRLEKEWKKEEKEWNAFQNNTLIINQLR